MTVFISHSFQDQSEFENVADWLDRLGVPYWKPAEIKSGASLRGQLRQAISSCSVCIFIATHNSVSSSWCGAELGAFWGVDIPVLVYLADSSLPDEVLPPILQGDVWDRRLSRIAARAAELAREREGIGVKGTISPSDRVTNMTVEQLEMIACAFTPPKGFKYTRSSIPAARRDRYGAPVVLCENRAHADIRALTDPATVGYGQVTRRDATDPHRGCRDAGGGTAVAEPHGGGADRRLPVARLACSVIPAGEVAGRHRAARVELCASSVLA